MSPATASPCVARDLPEPWLSMLTILGSASAADGTIVLTAPPCTPMPAARQATRTTDRQTQSRTHDMDTRQPRAFARHSRRQISRGRHHHALGDGAAPE